MRTDDLCERRRYPRTNTAHNRTVGASVALDSNASRQVKLFLVDLSRGGMRINVDRELPERQPLHFLFNPDGNANLSLSCQVVWKKDLVGGTWLHGVQFTDLPAEQQRRVDALIEEPGHDRNARNHFRLHRLLPMAIKTTADAGWRNCYAGDLSARGVGLQLDQPLPDDESIQVRLFPEFALPVVHARARLAWQSPGETGYRLGLCFENIDEISAQVIRRYIDRCLEAEPARGTLPCRDPSSRGEMGDITS